MCFGVSIILYRDVYTESLGVGGYVFWVLKEQHACTRKLAFQWISCVYIIIILTSKNFSQTGNDIYTKAFGMLLHKHVSSCWENTHKFPKSPAL